MVLFGWSFLVDPFLTDPFFIEGISDGSLTGPLSLQLLEEAVTSGFVASSENEAFHYEPVFQHDSVPPNFPVAVRKYVGE